MRDKTGIGLQRTGRAALAKGADRSHRDAVSAVLSGRAGGAGVSR